MRDHLTVPQQRIHRKYDTCSYVQNTNKTTLFTMTLVNNEHLKKNGIIIIEGQQRLWERYSPESIHNTRNTNVVLAASAVNEEKNIELTTE